MNGSPKRIVSGGSLQQRSLSTPCRTRGGDAAQAWVETGISDQKLSNTCPADIVSRRFGSKDLWLLKEFRAVGSEHLQSPVRLSLKENATAKQRMEAYNAERLKTPEAARNSHLHELLKRTRRVPKEKSSVRMRAYEVHRKVSAGNLHTELLLESEARPFIIVSLGSSCAVNLALLDMSLRKEAYPFDSMRTTLEGVLHFLDFDFADFIPKIHIEEEGEPISPWHVPRGKGLYNGKYHSFWHDNLHSPEDIAKYKRRVDRFHGLGSLDKALFFVFFCNCSFEVAGGERLLRSLRRLFGQNKIKVLLLVDGQDGNRLMEVEGTEGGLLVFCMQDDTFDNRALGVKNGVSAFLGHVNASSPSSKVEVVQSCAVLERAITPYSGGDPRAEQYGLKTHRHGALRSQTMLRFVDDVVAIEPDRHSSSLSVAR